jgi:biofilm PGA synthesis protein PgaD
MDQPGTGRVMLKSPIIERPVLPQSGAEKLVYGGITVLFWTFWLYLWLPVLALFAWALGIQQAYKYMVTLGGYRDLLELLILYALIIVMLGGALIAWAGYNIARFTGIERRVPHAAITLAQSALRYGVDVPDVERWQAARTLVVLHHEDGRIDRVEIPPMAQKAA